MFDIAMCDVIVLTSNQNPSYWKIQAIHFLNC